MSEPSPRPRPWRSWFLAAAPEGGRLPGLDALRGLLVLAVAMYHLTVWFGLHPSGSPANMAFAKAGNYGVSAFFILSGFLLVRTTPWSRVAQEGLKTYYLRRWFRLGPVFYLAVLANVALGLGMGPEPSLRFILENATLTFGLFHPNHALVTGGWFVGLVVLLHAAHPAVARLRANLRPGQDLVFLGALSLVLAAWSLRPTLYGVMGAADGSRFHAYVQPGNQLFLFVLGGLLARLHERCSWRLAPLPFLLLGALLLGLLLRPVPVFHDHLEALTGVGRYRYLALVAGLVMLFALRGGWPRWIDGPLARLGLWSYGLYLAHPFLYRAVQPWWGGWLGLWVSLGLSLAVAALLERWVERPLAALARGTRLKDQPSQA